MIEFQQAILDHIRESGEVKTEVCFQNGYPMSTSLAAQTSQFFRFLIARFKGKRMLPPCIGMAIVFQDVDFESQPTLADYKSSGARTVFIGPSEDENDKEYAVN